MSHSGENVQLPARPPAILYGLALLLLGAAVFVTPDLLMRLGPMSASLTSDIPMVKETTLKELIACRILCLLLALGALVLAWRWRSVTAWTPIRAVCRHRLIYPSSRSVFRNPLNFSFWTILVAVALGVYVETFGMRAFSEETLTMLNKEDGLIEDMTVVFFGCACIAALVASCEAKRWRRFTHVLFAVFFALCVGEEVSWGQRILGLSASGALANINVQQEINIHNLFGYFADHLFVAGVFLYGVVLPALAAYHPFWTKLFDKWGLPIPSPGLAIGFLLVSLLHKWTVYRVFSRGPDEALAEVREMIAALGFLLLMRESWLIERRARPVASAREKTPG